MLKKLLKINLLKNAGIYTLTSIINKAIPFLLMPILTRYLSPEDYGMLSMFSMLVTIVLPFISLNLNGAISRKYYDSENTNMPTYVFNCILIVITNTFVVSILFYFFSKPISKITFFHERALWIVIVFAFSEVIVNIILVLWQVKKNPLQFGLFTNLQTLTNFLLSILFVIVLKLGWEGRIYGQTLAYVLFALIAIIILIRNKWIKPSFNKQYIKHAFKFGVPLIPHALSSTIISMTDRLFITNMVGLAETGIYTVGNQIGSVINLIATAFNNAYIPWLYEKLKEDKYSSKVKIVKFTYVYFVGIFIVAIMAGLFAPTFLSVFLGKSYSGSSSYVIWIALGYAFQGMYLMVVNYIFYAQKTTLLAVVTFVTAAINIVFNYFFIKAFGAIGAAQATTLTYLIKFILVWVLSAKVYKMPWLEVLKMRK